METLCLIAGTGDKVDKKNYMKLLSKYCTDKTELSLPDFASKARTACPVCKGDYRKVCPVCNGTGKRNVSGIMGRGRKVCSTCKGEGVIICPTCKERRESYIFKNCVDTIRRLCSE